MTKRESVSYSMTMSSATVSQSKWRYWRVDPGSLVLVLQERKLPPYTINLRGITSSACMLDAIFKVREQEWVTDSILADLILAFQDLFDPRLTLCDGKKANQINLEAKVKESIQ